MSAMPGMNIGGQKPEVPAKRGVNSGQNSEEMNDMPGMNLSHDTTAHGSSTGQEH